MTHAIPTKYKGVQFRSRLEATWAAYFDLLGIPWEYEPFDLPGWIPDFRLKKGQGDFLVEVKHSPSEYGSAERKAGQACKGLDATVLFLASGPTEMAKIASFSKDDPFPGFSLCSVYTDSAQPYHDNNCKCFGGWNYRKWERQAAIALIAPVLTPCYDGHSQSPRCCEHKDSLLDLWLEARNLTQYKATR